MKMDGKETVHRWKGVARFEALCRQKLKCAENAEREYRVLSAGLRVVCSQKPGGIGFLPVAEKIESLDNQYRREEYPPPPPPPDRGRSVLGRASLTVSARPSIIWPFIPAIAAVAS